MLSWTWFEHCQDLSMDLVQAPLGLSTVGSSPTELKGTRISQIGLVWLQARFASAKPPPLA
eukprot:900048-Pelagomonas_calceolata.AAC.1